jgi:hypothetical protein
MSTWKSVILELCKTNINKDYKNLKIMKIFYIKFNKMKSF